MPPDPGSNPGGSSRPGVPPPPKKETNWAAVSALAGVAAAVVAFLAYAIPSGSPAPHPTPATETSAGSPVYTTTQQAQSSPPAPASPVFASSGLAVAQPSGPPAGCQQAITAINTYNQDVGSTRASEANAAQRALNEIVAADHAANYSGTVGADLDALDNDFGRLSNDAMAGASSDYSATASLASVDARQLEKDCSAG